ncbi:MAG: AAA family ATPase [Trueperaceae bacterium]
MIRIESIEIEQFRGVRQLKLAINGKNFGICGPNGTGKSGVVDAIEFCLTGDVTRLSGQGTSGLTLKSHAPHVDHRQDAGKSTVTVACSFPRLQKKATLRRSARSPKELQVFPEDAAIRREIKDLQLHPEFALSRREIAKYVITPPGRRSEDVQALLRLEHLEKLRKSFTSFRNTCRQEATRVESLASSAEKDLCRALDIQKLEWERLREKVNEARSVLGLVAIAPINDESSLVEGLDSDESMPGRESFNKAVAVADLEELQLDLQRAEPDALAETMTSARQTLEALQKDDQILSLVSKHHLLSLGLEQIDGDWCPLCDAGWDEEELRSYLQRRLDRAAEVGALLADLRGSIGVILGHLRDRILKVERAARYAQETATPGIEASLREYLGELRDLEKSLEDSAGEAIDLDAAIRVVAGSWWTPGQVPVSTVGEFAAFLRDLSNSPAPNTARTFLSVIQDRFSRYIRESKSATQQGHRAKIAQDVLDAFNSTATSVLENIYDQVAADFSRFYRKLNRGDEDQFTGKFDARPAKLGFDVDFYGRGLFPPGAYHSEGHQDGMGLCLYLALVKQTLGDKFTFAVLDDVLMSIDVGHRKEVCRLLKTEFPDTQFIITTHDRVWLMYMRAEGLIEHSQSFAGWTVDGGPQVLEDQEVWTDIRSELDKGDVGKAAWILRHYLEYAATVLAHSLRAKVEFRADGRYELGDLLPQVLKRWKKWLEAAEEAALRWKQAEARAALQTTRSEAKRLIGRCEVERWAMNPAVHYNAWANFQRHEFEDVVNAFHELMEHVRCQNCNSYPYVSPQRGKEETLKCNCGQVNYNLRQA